MKVRDWTFVEEAGEYRKLPVGGYVVRIEAVEDCDRTPDKEYLDVTYDIAEGEFAGIYAGQDKKYHRFRRYYGGNAAVFFKAFLNRLEESNPTFRISEWQRTCNPQALVGLKVGVVFQERMYTNDQGKDCTVLQADTFKNVADIRSGAFTIPEPDDKRTKVEQPAFAADAVYDTPF